MLDSMNYELMFNETLDSIPKSIKGDYISIHEIKLSKNKLYTSKNDKFTSTKEEKSNTEENPNGNNNNPTSEVTEKSYKYCISTFPDNLIYFPNKDHYTNDKDLKQLIDLFNEPNTKEFGYSNVIDEEK